MKKNFLKELDRIDKVRSRKCHLRTLMEGRKTKEGGGMVSDPYVYQYRSLESFWAIIESDSFWATNARFSNDQEEQKLGMRKIQELLGDDAKAVNSLGDCYIVCFCDEGDKLSQWRGYAPEGVSIGFDFNNVRPFYIKKKDEDAYLCVYNSCYKVQYIHENTEKPEFAHKFDLNLSNDKNNHENIRHRSADIIPYVKHRGFYEESESRLMFSDRDGDLSQCIHYKNEKNIKLPYIIVKAGDKEEQKKKVCVIRLNFEESRGEEIRKELVKYFVKRRLRNVKVINCADIKNDEMDDRACFGCTLREAYIPGINSKNPRCAYACKNDESFHVEIRKEIYISDSKSQEQVYNEVRNFIRTKKGMEDTKIWCEGHLPIRSIRVGNLRNKETVVESIRHYCSQHYWLQSVKVESSDTPFRSSLY